MNRGDLKARVLRWAKGGSSTRLPLDDIFADAQEEIIRTVHPLELDVFAQLDQGAAQQWNAQVWVHQLPADFLDAFMITNNQTRLRSKRLDGLVNDWGRARRDYSGENKPAYYTIAGRALYTAPGNGGDLRIGYMSRDEAIGVDAGENVVMQRFPEVYFWGMMLGVHLFYENQEGYSMAVGRFREMRSQINTTAAAGRLGGGGSAVNV